MVCDILDLRCVIVNELIGSVALAMIIGAIAYFIFASKIRLGFDTTILMALPLALIFAMVVTGFYIIYAFAAVVVGIFIAVMVARFMGNR